MSRRAPARGPLLAVALAVIAATTSRAQAKTTLQALGTAAAGWTDNVLNAPDEPVPGQRGRESDFFFQLGPGAALTTSSPRFIQRLGYTFTADLFVEHPDGNSYGNALDWAAYADTTQSTELLLVARSQQGRLSTFNLQLPSAAGQAAVLPNNTAVNFFSQFVAETFTWNLTPKWRSWETGSFRLFIPIDRGKLADTYDASGELGAERVFDVDALGLLARSEYIIYKGLPGVMNMPAAPDQEQIINTLMARWRRDWSVFWSTEAALGVVEAEPLHVARSTRLWQPTGLAALRYTRDLASAELRYTHEVLANALAGNSFLYDEVSLQGALPLPAKSHLFIGATATYQHARALDTSGGLTDTYAHVALVDFTINWQPIPELGVFARYSLFDQLAHNQPPPIDPMAPQVTALPDMLRNTVLVGINVVYPAVAAARVPTRSGTRVDRSDQPAIPEYHAPTPR
jgi:hypothetical protein